MARTVAPPPTKFGQRPLQAKPAGGTPRVAPPPTKFARAAGLQAKPVQSLRSPRAAPPPTRFAAAGRGAARTVQRASLERHPFSSTTQKTVTLSKGQHRRHIIPHHLMKAALQAWGTAHKTTAGLQALLDRLNNHVPNLIPGEGVQNSAMGMISTWSERKLDAVDVGTSTPSDLSTLFSTPSGFYQDRQKAMLTPVTSVFGSDPTLSSSSESAYAYALNITDSTDFDWPGGTKMELQAWLEAYHGFQSLKNNAADFDPDGLMAVCNYFLSLTAPSGHH